MNIILFIARLLICAVFLAAGVAKLLDLEGSRRALREFGVPEGPAKLIGWGLPLLEISTALSLLPRATAWWGALAALALLSIFSIGISGKIAQGKSPDCHCFGRIHSEPVGWPALLRNLIFLAVASIIVIFGKNDPGLSSFAWIGRLTTGEAINLFADLLIAGLLIRLMVRLSEVSKSQNNLLDTVERIESGLDEDLETLPLQYKQVSLPQEGLPIGAAAPDFELPALGGENVSFGDLIGRGKPLLLVFVSPNCSGCKTLMPVTRLWQRDYSDRVSVAVITRGSIEDNLESLSRYDIEQLLIDNNLKVAATYQAEWTPGAVLVAPDGKIASHLVYGDTAIREFFRSLTQHSAENRSGIGRVSQVSLRYPARNIGEASPLFALPDLNDRIVALDDLKGSPSILLFWDPACSHCSSLTDALNRWEDQPPAGAPRLIFISGGSRDEIMKYNRRFKSPTLVDPGFDVAPLFGAQSTPSAILLDSDGKIASSLAVGAVNVKALIGIRPS